MADPVFVSPHYDDVALSCGGTVAWLARSSSPLIVTLFSEGPGDAPLNDYARTMLADWGLSPAEVVERRRAEDRCAARALGRSVRTLWLPYRDAIFRDPEISSDEELMGDGAVVADISLAEDIARDLAQLDGSEYYLPLAAGGHVDHQIAFRAGELLADDGRTVWLYSDMPYAIIDADGYQARVGAVAGYARREVWLTAQDFERRWAAIECYTSQHAVIFRDLVDPRSQFLEFHARGTRGELVEWFWCLVPA